jgi:hypothetical protein
VKEIQGMRSVPTFSALLLAVALLPGCEKKAEQSVAVPQQAAVKQAAEQQPFLRSGENLTINVDAMPLQVFLGKLGELTGVKITADTEGNPAITMHVEDASIRKVLGMALADRPYSVTLHYTNLQDSFPSSAVVSRYQTAVVQPEPGAERTSQIGGGSESASSTYAASEPAPMPAPEPQPAVDEEPDFASMEPDDRLAYFLGKPTDEQVALVFDMEPTPEDAKLMETLLQRPEMELEVKLEMLDSLSNAEYADALPAIKVGLNSSNDDEAAKAVEVLGSLGSEKDIPMLKKIAEEHADDPVGEAAKDAIDTLQP